MLAPRIVHFSQRQVFWDCTEISACETVPSGLPLALERQSAADRHWRGRLQESVKGTMLLSGVNDDSLEDFWKVTVEDYTKLDLTKQSDKRMAIWGVAKRMRDTLDEDYVAGMWRDNLEEQLLWRVVDCNTTVRPKSLTVNPTWSWMSVHGAVRTAARSKRPSRSYTVTSHSGGQITFHIEADNARPGPTRKHSNNAKDMERELYLADERRRKSSAASRHQSQSEPTSLTAPRGVARDTHTDSSSSPRSMSPERTDSQSSMKDLGLNQATKQKSQLNLDDKWDKEPELQDNKIAIQGYLNEGTLKLKNGRSNSHWSLEEASTWHATAEIEAFPDQVPEAESTEVVFVVLYLMNISEGANEATSADDTWYQGHGLMLRQTKDELSYERIGSLCIRRLSHQTWQQWKGDIDQGSEIESFPTSHLGTKFWLM